MKAFGNLSRLGAMNELPVIGSLCFREEFWDRCEANIASRREEIYGERLFRRPKKDNLEKDHRYFVAVLSEMD